MVALAADGAVAWSVGDVDGADAAALVQQAGAGARHGAARPRPAAPSCSRWPAPRHSGEPFHIEGVRRILASAGLSEADLQTPPDYPLDDAAREAVIREGGRKAPVLMNCSGKHAAMLATCVRQRLADRDLPRPRPPAAAGDRAPTFAELTGEPVAVDGGRRLRRAAALGVAAGLARAFRRSPRLGARHGPERRVADAIRPTRRTSPGPRATSARCSPPIPGAIGKAGAESCYAVALPDGRAFALKTDDGAPRVRAGADGGGAAAVRRARASRVWTRDAVRRTGSSSCSAAGVPSVRSAPSSAATA